MVAVGMVGLLEGRNDWVESLDTWLVLGLEVLPQDLVEVIHGWDRLSDNLGHGALQRSLGAFGGVLLNTSGLSLLLMPRA
jgi:hypothetical protein